MAKLNHCQPFSAIGPCHTAGFLVLVMAPSATELADSQDVSVRTKQLHARRSLKSSGSLESFDSINITPVIGTEFPEANLVQWLNAPNADELLRDLAIKSKPIRAYLRMRTCALTNQSLSVVSYSSGNRTISRTISRRNSFSDLVN